MAGTNSREASGRAVSAISGPLWRALWATFHNPVNGYPRSTLRRGGHAGREGLYSANSRGVIQEDSGDRTTQAKGGLSWIPSGDVASCETDVETGGDPTDGSVPPATAGCFPV